MNVIAMLIGFIALIALVNFLLGKVGGWDAFRYQIIVGLDFLVNSFTQLLGPWACLRQM